MRNVVIAFAFGAIAMGCGGSSSPEQDLIGNWLYATSTGSTGIAVTYKTDGTYVAAELVLTSSNTADAQVETGTYTATASELTSVPTEWTCPGPDPAGTASYSFSGGDLLISSSSGIISLAPNTAPASSTFILTYGCFQSDGSFVTAPLAPVSNT
jgi:hypothetical protein